MEKISRETFESVRKYALAAEKEERFQHSVRVAETARRMCEIYGEDGDAGYFAGLAHDMCKDLDDGTLLSLAGHDGQAVSEIERKKPALLHGRAAAVKLERDFGVTDRDILQSVAMHTLGGEGMCPLAKIVFAADKIEPGRPQSSEKYLRNLFSKKLDELLLAVVQENMDYLASRGKEIAPSSLVFKKSLEKSLGLL
ncbi:MAG: bis(5'-nucleosyl)-tetraphosphatase (symmetrical) YqeK [Treponema sp.]|nr:bis(5'-nucleosyl)-tetraphosphatase (symmetrical) YqeK [Treponema sp.]MBQ2553137.1 bis(5'-nucleosyl)-tetraphosphatase (symmetrical) YqeK [Treponema sp.]MBQ4237467.1 bis(5'-nucleosyl)-tetraphosphatase (symmetrical) YqeK [Treponema sp.]MBQ5385046.1 bis(5'-nucleosyl)-tetraphosphatase (symmetrical) YqeK [Treponema sp.]